MSTLSQFGGGGIKSIQRGVITVPGSTQTGTATITAVNTAKSELRLLGMNGVDQAPLGQILYAMTRIQLTNSTTITANLQYASNGASLVSWELTEWN